MLAAWGSQTGAGMWSPAGFFGSRWAEPQKGIPIIHLMSLAHPEYSVHLGLDHLYGTNQ